MKHHNILSAPSVWVINNPIVSSLLTFAILILGFISFDNIQQESSPSFKTNEIIIEAIYPGSTPKDIVQSIIINLSLIHI